MQAQHPEKRMLSRWMLECEIARSSLKRFILAVERDIDYGDLPEGLKAQPGDSDDIADLIEALVDLESTPRVLAILGAWADWVGGDAELPPELTWHVDDSAGESELLEALTILTELVDAPRVDEIIGGWSRWSRHCANAEAAAGLPMLDEMHTELAAEQRRIKVKLAMIHLGDRTGEPLPNA